jgi:hypothetical protein
MEQQVLNNNNSCDNVIEEFPIDIKDEEFVSITADDAYTAIENETVQLYTQIANKKKCRQFVLVVPISVIVIFVLYYKKMMSTWIISTISFVGSWTIFWTYPQISVFLHHKPIYIEDLIVNSASHDIKYKFIKYYSYLTNISLAILFMCIADYTFYKYSSSIGNSLVETLGIIGGVSSLYFKLQSSVGKVILSICYKLKNRQINTLSSNLKKIPKRK